MSLFQIEHPDASPTVISAAGLFVHDGYLHATRYGGEFVPGRTECEATWAPGRWLSFRSATACPTCKRDVPQWS